MIPMPRGPIAAIVMLAACSSSAPRAVTSRTAEMNAPCASLVPAGTRAELTTAVHSTTGPDIDEPITCSREPGAYIRIHGHGTRPIGFAPPNGCHEAGCVIADELGTALSTRLRTRGIEVFGVGAGVCADTSGDYEAWNMSARIGAWKSADEAVAIVDDELRARDLRGDFGISVQGDSWPCLGLESGSSTAALRPAVRRVTAEASSSSPSE
jgi:hypothetical protein